MTSTSTAATEVVVAPCIHIPYYGVKEEEEDKNIDQTLCQTIVETMERTGFLRVTSPLIPLDLQEQVLKDATDFLEGSTNKNTCATTNDETSSSSSLPCPQVLTHPTDPKLYTMLTNSKEASMYVSSTIFKYWNALETLKFILLKCFAIGLKYKDINYFTNLHNENNSTMRLLKYPKIIDTETSKFTGTNRCKEHSDYGTLTLLLTDGISGLEAYYNNQWIPVPYQKGSIVINAGSLMERWTNGRIKATLHRVAGPTSNNSLTCIDILKDASKHDRTSIAFFADPNENVKIALSDSSNALLSNKQKDMNVATYIKERCGYDGTNLNNNNNNEHDQDTASSTSRRRSGVAFTNDEELRLKGSTTRTTTK